MKITATTRAIQIGLGVCLKNLLSDQTCEKGFVIKAIEKSNS
jgi:hypothetical protein